MKTIAITSTTGGAGRTTLTAALAVLLARRGRPVVAVEFDAQNLMGATLGLDSLAEHGLAQSVLGGAEPWHAHTWRSADGVLFVPYGHVDAAGAAACDARLTADPAWLSRALDDIALPADGVVLIDTARYPSAQAEQAIRRADLTLVVVPPEPTACATTAARLAALRAGGGDLQIVVNRLNPARDMQRDALAMLRAVAGPATILEQRIHVDAAVPEALARGSWIF
ncbi:cellulose biosynthesis protein BcsQ, partial [Burkholderia sp. Ac-20344]|uniref:cellulose biosynthesis protein BcsQ n=1 Tax=Burkholderia sp. Ac-20344 TaxID=2703890 RepID=UPI00197BEB36